MHIVRCTRPPSSSKMRNTMIEIRAGRENLFDVLEDRLSISTTMAMTRVMSEIAVLKQRRASQVLSILNAYMF